jgi:hypothetical protein
MARFYFRYHGRGRSYAPQQLDAGDLSAALRQGNRAVAKLLKRMKRAPSRVDIEDERFRVIAQILSADVAMQLGLAPSLSSSRP